MTGVEKEPLDLGQGRLFQAPLQRTAEATRTAFMALQLGIKSETRVDSLTWMVIATSDATPFSYGEIVRAVITGRTDSTSEVRVFTRKRMATNLFARGDWSKQVFQEMAKVLADSGAVLEPPVATVAERRTM